TTQFATLVSSAPVPQDSGNEAGEPTVPAPGPLLPLEKSGKIPALTQFCTPVRKVASVQTVLPQLLLEMCGRTAGLGCVPCRRVGARVQWKPARIALVSHELLPLRPQTRTVIHIAARATPMLP